MSSKSRVRALTTNAVARPDFSIEKSIDGHVCGLDEVGRAPLAGPVVAACVFIEDANARKKIWREVNDSKVLSVGKREALAFKIKEHAVWAIAEASHIEIETLNIVQASFLAMRRAFGQCFTQPVTITALIDGHIIPREFPCPAKAIIKGDGKSVSIAAASIIAKVYRDALMKKLAEEHPHYGWERNAGYAIGQHQCPRDHDRREGRRPDPRRR